MHLNSSIKHLLVGAGSLSCYRKNHTMRLYWSPEVEMRMSWPWNVLHFDVWKFKIMPIKKTTRAPVRDAHLMDIAQCFATSQTCSYDISLDISLLLLLFGSRFLLWAASLLARKKPGTSTRSKDDILTWLGKEVWRERALRRIPLISKAIKPVTRLGGASACFSCRCCSAA